MSLTRKDVVHAYRTFLGRGPQSEERAHALRTGRVPVDMPPVQVDVEVDEETLKTLLGHVRRCWEFMGRERPHHSVLTDPNFLPDALRNNEAEFWNSGERDAEVLVKILARHGNASLSDLSCIDFGCGVGRVTAPLATRFSTVNAYDISAPHIEIAKHRAGDANFHLLRELPVSFLPTDIFYSRIVLQHNPPPIIALLIKSALDCLKPRGIAVFQVPTYETAYSFVVERYLKKLAKSSLNMEMHCLPQHHVFRLARETGCDVLEIREEDSTGRAGSDISNLFVIQRPPI